MGFDYHKPKAVPRGLDGAKQQAFIDGYENLLNTMGVDEAINLRPPPASGLMPPILGPRSMEECTQKPEVAPLEGLTDA